MIGNSSIGEKSIGDTRNIPFFVAVLRKIKWDINNVVSKYNIIKWDVFNYVNRLNIVRWNINNFVQ
ncbi:MAG: hypothetical protein PHC31_13475, partial [Clostridia bacterium]|nr:hypothetical protein [Clostridia bacterium]